MCGIASAPRGLSESAKRSPSFYGDLIVKRVQGSECARMPRAFDLLAANIVLKKIDDVRLGPRPERGRHQCCSPGNLGDHPVADHLGFDRESPRILHPAEGLPKLPRLVRRLANGAKPTVPGRLSRHQSKVAHHRDVFLGQHLNDVGTPRGIDTVSAVLHRLESCPQHIGLGRIGRQSNGGRIEQIRRTPAHSGRVFAVPHDKIQPRIPRRRSFFFRIRCRLHKLALALRRAQIRRCQVSRLGPCRPVIDPFHVIPPFGPS